MTGVQTCALPIFACFLFPSHDKRGGAGGQSTNVNTASVHGANAPVGGGEAIQMQQLGLQMAMQKAQIDNINADTKNKEAQTPNINADTNKKLSEIELLKEQTTNTHVKTALDKVELNIQQLNQQFQAETYADRVNLITWTANKMVNEWKQAENQTYISEKTRDTVITTIQRECIQKLLQNELLKSQNTKTQTPNINADTKHLAVIYYLKAVDILNGIYSTM